MCSLRFENNFLTIEGVRDIEENTFIKAFVRFRFASVAITNKYAAPAGSLSFFFCLGAFFVAGWLCLMSLSLFRRDF